MADSVIFVNKQCSASRWATLYLSLHRGVHDRGHRQTVPEAIGCGGGGDRAALAAAPRAGRQGLCVGGRGGGGG